MPGATSQLMAVGQEDIFLTDTPNATLFKEGWKKFTPFAMEVIPLTWNGDADFGKRPSVTLGKAGSVVVDTWLHMSLPDLTQYTHIPPRTPQAAVPVISRAAHDGTSVSVTMLRPNNSPELYTVHLGLADAPEQRDAQPMIRSVAFVTSTAAVVTLVPPRVTQLDSYAVTLTELDDPTAITYQTSSTTDITVSGLSLDKTYVVTSSQPEIFPVLIRGFRDAPPTSPTVTLAGVQASAEYTAWAVGAKVSPQAPSSPATPSSASATERVAKLKWCDAVGHAILASTTLYIGGMQIDQHCGEFYDVWTELTERAEKRAGFNRMIGKFDGYSIHSSTASTGGAQELFVPLRFFYARDTRLSLPVCALTMHEARLDFSFRKYQELIRSNVSIPQLYSVTATPTSLATAEPHLDVTALATYAFLSEPEVVRFKELMMERVIEQMGMQTVAVSANETSKRIKLEFSHPVKELMFTFTPATSQVPDSFVGNDIFNYEVPGAEDFFTTAKLVFDGTDRQTARPARWYRLVEPYKHHTCIPSKKVYTFSFAIDPEQFWPNGTANFSRLQSAYLHLQLTPNIPSGFIRVFAIKYNVLRIAQGQGQVIFAG